MKQDRGMCTQNYHLLQRTMLLLLVFLLGSGQVMARMYRGLDANGNVIYSDTPFEDAEKYTPPPISVVDAAKPEAQQESGEDKKPAADAEQPFRYLAFDITSPAYRETLSNPAYVPVSLDIKPSLNIAEQHTIWLLLDGQAMIKNSRETVFRLDDVPRGGHQVQAQIRDASGKVLVRSRPVVFFVFRSSSR